MPGPSRPTAAASTTTIRNANPIVSGSTWSRQGSDTATSRPGPTTAIT